MRATQPGSRRKVKNGEIYNSVISQVNFYRSTIVEFLPAEHDPWAALHAGNATRAEGECFLVKLPPELRLRIYEYVLARKGHITLSRREQSIHRGLGPTLFRVSAALRNEGMPTYFKTNSFELRTKHTEFDRLAIWIRTLRNKGLLTSSGQLSFVMDGPVMRWMDLPQVLPFVKLIAAGQLKIDVSRIKLRPKQRDQHHAAKSGPFKIVPREGAGYIQSALEEAVLLPDRAQREGWSVNRLITSFQSLGLDQGRDGLWWQRYRQRLKKAADAKRARQSEPKAMEAHSV